MIVDTSAAMAILLLEPEATVLASAIARSTSPVHMSAGSAIELGVVCLRHADDRAEKAYRDWLDVASITIIPVDEEQVRIAWRAYAAYGRGRHPAALNFGDCFAYALARQTGLPLLFKGDDFAKTDVVPATW